MSNVDDKFCLNVLNEEQTDIDIFSNLLKELEENINEDDKEDDNDKEDKISKISKIFYCKHENIFDESNVKTCLDCGIELSRDISCEKEWRYYGSEDTRKNSDPSRCHIRKSEDKSIFKDLDSLGFPERIIKIANDIYNEVTCGKIYRGNSRKAIVFGCIFQTYKIIGNPKSYDNLRETFNLERKVGLKGLKLVSLNLPKHINIITKYITPTELIEEIMTKLNTTTQQKKEIEELYNKIKNKSPILNRSRPQSIASSIIYYYLSKQDDNIKIKDFIKKVKLSELTVNKLIKVIKKILEE
jgi:hypothetical protein